MPPLHCNSVYHFPDRCPFCGGKSPVSSANDRQPFSLGCPPTPRTASQPTDPPADSQTHHPTFVETLTTEESVHDHIVPFITIANAVEGPIQGSSVPTPQDSHSPSTEGRGLRTPLRPLILEWELSNHPDKTFIKQLLSDIRQGCNIGYTGPQFAHTAHNLQSAFSHPLVLDNALAVEYPLNRILGSFDSPLYPTSDALVWA